MSIVHAQSTRSRPDQVHARRAEDPVGVWQGVIRERLLESGKECWSFHSLAQLGGTVRTVSGITSFRYVAILSSLSARVVCCIRV